MKNLGLGKSGKFQNKDLLERIDLKRAAYNQPSAISKAFYTFLLKRNPRSFFNGSEIYLEELLSKANKKNKHHIFPQKADASLSNRDIKDIHSVVNLCFLTAEENKMIRNKKPKNYFHKMEGDNKNRARLIYKSHLIPYDDDSGIKDPDFRRGFRKFKANRLALLCKAINAEAKIKIFN